MSPVMKTTSTMIEYFALIRSFLNEFNSTKDLSTGQELLRLIDELDTLIGRLPDEETLRSRIDNLMEKSKNLRVSVCKTIALFSEEKAFDKSLKS